MKDNNIQKPVSFRELQWDTDFFGVSCAKAILHKKLEKNDWNNIKEKFAGFQFVAIENINSEPLNAKMIGTDTKAFLADVNIQFIKSIKDDVKLEDDIKIYQSMKRENKILDIANFKYSKFIQDIELSKRGGPNVYRQWIINSFEKQDKFFAVSLDANGDINGFLLHSYTKDACIIELIAVSDITSKKGIGTSLFKSVEYSARQNGFNEIKVGTQIRNLPAINFYHKVGCKQFGCHQVYHLWNL